MSSSASRLLAAVALLAACHRRPAPPPTYHGAVAEILARHCVRCHGAAPPPLASYEAAARVAGRIRLAVERREMPPFGADDTGLCGSWRDAAWLDAAEIATLAAWAAAGAPRGDPAPPPPPPPAPAPGRRLEPVAEFTPRLGAGAVRCFRLDAAAGFLTGYHVASEPPDAVRQASLFALTEEGAAAARARDDADPEPGWTCPGDPGLPDARLVASWAESTPAPRLPDGAGIPLGAPLLLQVRANLFATGLERPVRVWLEADLAAEARMPLRALPLRAAGFHLPPGQRQTEVTAELTLDAAARLVGVVPHMRSLGRVLRLEVAGGACLLYLGHHDLYNEQLFRAARATPLAAGDRLRLTCSYNTRGREEEVAEGPEIDDEACGATLFLAAP